MDKKETILDILEVAYKITVAGKVFLTAILEKYNINQTEYYLLRYLYKNPGEIQYNIVKETKQTKSRINQIVNKLESMKYIEKRPMKIGELIKKPIFITPNGEKLIKEIIKITYNSSMIKLKKKEKMEFGLYREKLIKILEFMNSILRVKCKSSEKIS